MFCSTSIAIVYLHSLRFSKAAMCFVVERFIALMEPLYRPPQRDKSLHYEITLPPLVGNLIIIEHFLYYDLKRLFGLRYTSL